MCRGANTNLELYTAKTKEIVVDFRRTKSSVDPLTINGKVNEIIDCLKVTKAGKRILNTAKTAGKHYMIYSTLFG